jgi:tetratricopeptide (TPR) repeat protein
MTDDHPTNDHMSEVEHQSRDEIDQAQNLLGQTLSFASHDLALAFLYQHRHRINRSLVALLKDEVASLVRVDLERALAVADLTSEAAALSAEPVSQALSYHARAMVLYWLGKHTQSLELYNNAQAIYRSLGHELDAARMARAKIQALTYLGRYEEALQEANEARQLFQQHDQPALVAQVDANLGNLYERLDQYRTALAYYQRAADTFEQLHDRQSLAVVQTNMALVYSSLSEFETSLSLYEQARRIYQALGLHRLAVEVDYHVAWLYFLRGRFDHTLKQFQWVEAQAIQYGDATQSAMCRLDLAEVYLQLNAFEDALESAQSAMHQFTQLQMNYELAKATMYAGVAHLHQGAFAQAAVQLQQARSRFTQEGNAIHQALCDLYASEAAVRQKKWDQALTLCHAAGAIFEANQLNSKAAYTQFQLARIQFRAGDLAAAQASCERSLHTLEALEAPWLKYQCFHLRGNLAERFGHERHARQSYRQAIKHIEEMRSTIGIDEFKATFVKDKLRVYEDLVRLCLQHGSPEKKEEAFQLVEAAKSRTLVDLLSGARRMKHNARAGDDRELIGRWDALREELDWYYNKLNGYDAANPPRPAGADQELRQKIRERETELTKLLRRLQLKDSEYASLQTVTHLGSADIASALADDEVLLEYYTTGDEIHVFVIDASGLRTTQPLAPAWPMFSLLKKLRFQLNKPLLEPDYVSRHEAVLRRSVDERLQALHEGLIRPVAAALAGKQVVIVPHGFLHYVPFHALFDGRDYLIDHHEISYAPSAHAFRLCRQRHRTAAADLTSALIVGAPYEGLPHIAEEVAAIRSLIPNAELLVGENANLEQFKRRAERCRYLHLASHATFRHDNPLFSSLKLADSWLNFYDIFDLNLQAELVTLSACETGVNHISGGDELIGLMRGFLYAGAPSLILSLWAVNDRSTAELMGALYARLNQGHSARRALRDAQIAIRDNYPHPYHWAPFVLMGRPSCFMRDWRH